MLTVRVQLGERSYDIAVTSDDSPGLGPFARQRSRAGPRPVPGSLARWTRAWSMYSRSEMPIVTWMGSTVETVVITDCVLTRSPTCVRAIPTIPARRTISK